jgi:hypothetical protein
LSRTIGSALVLAALVIAAGCGDDGDSNARAERADAPASPPRGWKTVRNRPAGFTLSVPRNWSARMRRAATVIRSKGRSLAITVAADRGKDGRNLSPTEYARRTLEALPDFEGSVLPRVRRVRGSPYRSSRVNAIGSLRTSKRSQRITVVAYQRPGLVTYALVAFANRKAPPGFFEPRLRRVLRSLRAQPAHPS